MIFPQPLMIFLCLAIPALLLYGIKRPLWAVAWIAAVTVVDIFNSQLYLNLPAVILFGAMALPYLWKNRTQLIRNRAALSLMGYFTLLVILGVYYGFLNPWPDPTGMRGPKDLAPMRTILHLGRTFLEFCTVFFLVLQIEFDPKGTLRSYLRSLFYASIVLCLAALVEKYLRVDFYHFFTGGRALLIEDRVRGLAYEPRGLSQNVVHALFLLPFVPLSKWKYLATPLFLFVGFVCTFSFSGIMILAAGLLSLSIYLLIRERTLIKTHLTKILMGLGAAALVMALVLMSVSDAGKQYMGKRLDVVASPNIVDKLEVFDAAAVNFLNHNPQHYLFGTGPGLIYLPATNYVLARDLILWPHGFEALPHMGAILILSNAGILGLLIFGLVLLLGVLRKPFGSSTYSMIGVILMGIFFIQIRYFFLFGFASLIADEKEGPST